MGAPPGRARSPVPAARPGPAGAVGGSASAAAAAARETGGRAGALAGSSALTCGLREARFAQALSGVYRGRGLRVCACAFRQVSPGSPPASRSGLNAPLPQVPLVVVAAVPQRLLGSSVGSVSTETSPQLRSSGDLRRGRRKHSTATFNLTGDSSISATAPPNLGFLPCHSSETALSGVTIVLDTLSSRLMAVQQNFRQCRKCIAALSDTGSRNPPSSTSFRSCAPRWVPKP
ncbi:uncharacterized protein LOC119537204 [Choloepus didactylus]|uniref:uncharacterized protein LOC119537204 n=1 Tax=Choloepus didactylus TaxID=27675 RepID=UPI00189F84A2|nr:uncharacterized protein LOC119537204 [Choloepus didactylus]